MTTLFATIYPANEGPRSSEIIAHHLEVGPISLPPYEYDGEESKKPESVDAAEANKSKKKSNLSIELRFGQTFGPLGFVFGTKSDCNVVLPKGIGFSLCQLSLTFDECYRLIIRDWGSSMGTGVIYEEQGAGRRRDFQWIVGGPQHLRNIGDIVVKLSDDVAFRIVPEKIDMGKIHHQNVKLFLGGCPNDATAVDNLAKAFPARTSRLSQCSTTTADLETELLGTEDIYLKFSIGTGSFGDVHHWWAVSGTDEYAMKECSLDQRRLFQKDLADEATIDEAAKIDLREAKEIIETWEREAKFLENLRHPHIVSLFEATLDPWPKLKLEYMPHGSILDMQKQRKASANEILEILKQCSSALRYLHDQSPPIAHRDIKQGNVLVYRRPENGRIEVKLGDFGLAKQQMAFNSGCGTDAFIAPEVATIKQLTPRNDSVNIVEKWYGPKSDVWPLGNLVFELTLQLMSKDLPHWTAQCKPERNGDLWCRKLLTSFTTESVLRMDSTFGTILFGMLQFDPKDRAPAWWCEKEAGTVTALFKEPYASELRAKIDEQACSIAASSEVDHKQADDGTTARTAAGAARDLPVRSSNRGAPDAPQADRAPEVMARLKREAQPESDSAGRPMQGGLRLPKRRYSEAEPER